MQDSLKNPPESDKVFVISKEPPVQVKATALERRQHRNLLIGVAVLLIVGVGAFATMLLSRKSLDLRQRAAEKQCTDESAPTVCGVNGKCVNQNELGVGVCATQVIENSVQKGVDQVVESNSLIQIATESGSKAGKANLSDLKNNQEVITPSSIGSQLLRVSADPSLIQVSTGLKRIDQFMNANAQAYLFWQYSGDPNNPIENDPFSFFTGGATCKLLKATASKYPGKIGVNIYRYALRQDDSTMDGRNVRAVDLAYLKNECGTSIIRFFAWDTSADLNVKAVKKLQTAGIKAILAVGNFAYGDVNYFQPQNYAADKAKAIAIARSLVKEKLESSMYALELMNEPHCKGIDSCLPGYIAWVNDMTSAIRATGYKGPISIGQAASLSYGDIPGMGFEESNRNSALTHASGHHYDLLSAQRNLQAAEISKKLNKVFYIGEASRPDPFSELRAVLDKTSNVAKFEFTKDSLLLPTNETPFFIDISTDKNDTFFTNSDSNITRKGFASGTSTSLLVTNPNGWSPMVCGKKLYWRIRFSDLVSKTMESSVVCPTAFTNLGGTFTTDAGGTNGLAEFRFVSQLILQPNNVPFVIEASSDPTMTVVDQSIFTYGNTSPIRRTGANNWDKYTCGNRFYWRVRTWNSSHKSPIQTATPTCANPPKFTNLSAVLNTDSNTARFLFTGPSSLSYFEVDIASDPSWNDIRFNFGNAKNSPINVVNPKASWNKFVCGQTVYWRVRGSPYSNAICSNLVECPRSGTQSTKILCMNPPTSPIAPAPAPIVNPPTVAPSPTAPYTNLSGSINLYPNIAQNTSEFRFTYNAFQVQLPYIVDISTDPNMNTDVFVKYAVGTQAPILDRYSEKWAKVTCGRRLYWVVRTNDSGYISPIQSLVVSCPQGEVSYSNPSNNFSKLSESIWSGQQAVFAFTPSNRALGEYKIDLSTRSDWPSDESQYFSGFVIGNGTTLTVLDAAQRWDKFRCNTQLFWRVTSSNRYTSETKGFSFPCQ